MSKKKEPQNSEFATQLADHLNNIRKLVLDADQLVHQARQEANAIKRIIERSKNNDG
jgi:type IV secretory pathway TrbF-like protein